MLGVSEKEYRYYFRLDDGIEGKAAAMMKNESTKTVQFIDVKITDGDAVREHYYYVVPEEKVVEVEEKGGEKQEEERQKRRARRA